MNLLFGKRLAQQKPVRGNRRKARLRFLNVLAFMLLAGGPVQATSADFQLRDWAVGLDHPWSLAFLPDGGALVTELKGSLRRIDAAGIVGNPLNNIPDVYFAGQGGLFDVVLHPDFERNGQVYLSFAEGSPASNGTAIARGRLAGNGLEDVETIFTNFTRKDTSAHYGGRMVFLDDGSLLLTTGDGFDLRESAQDVDSGLGKVLRMRDDGSPPVDHPFPGSPFVYSYGHRNPQGLARDRSGTVWLHEHGPRGGDEVNHILAGVNYGWPAITHGVDYSGATISPYTEWDGMAQPVHHWTPSIAPSGLAVYEADLFPAWRGSLFVGALVDREVRRLELRDGRVIREEALFSELDARVRDVRVGPEGALYLLLPTRIVRVLPAQGG